MNKIITRNISLGLALLFLFLLSTRAPAEDFYTEDNTLKRTLDNGMTVVIHEMRKIPIAAIDITLKTGSATEGKFSGSGISHLVEHMLFKGVGGKDTKSYSEKMKAFGGSINGFTSHDYTDYVSTIPSENIVEALKILRDIITLPSFDALELKKEKEVILDEIRRNKDEYARFALDLSWTLVFQEHPYKYPIIGYEDLFARIEKKDVEEYYETRYSPHNMILAISGDVEKDKLFTKVEDIFSPLKRNFVPVSPNTGEPPQQNQRRCTKYKPISLAHVVLSYKSASIYDKMLYPLDILNIVLGEGEDSVLTKELRNKRKLVHYITCQNYTLRDSGLFYIYFATEGSKVDSAISAIREELEKIKKNGITDYDLKKSQRIVKARFIDALETAGGRARDISMSEAIANDYNFSETYLSKIPEVKAEDVKSAANVYLKTEYLNTVCILPEEKKEAVQPSDSTEGLHQKIIKEAMSNGIRIIICEDHSTPTCSISALFLGGVRAENDINNGITYLVSELLLDGTAKRDEENIKSEIESLGGSIQPIHGNNSFGITVNLLSEDWEKGIEIISDAIMTSMFNNDMIEKERNLALAAIKERDDNIISSGILLFKQNFFKEHPYRLHHLGTVNSIQNISRNDIVNYYNSLCVSGNMVFTVTGDINIDKVMAMVKKQFSTFKSMEPKLPNPPIPKTPQEKTEIVNSMKREQSMIIVGFPSVKITDKDRYIFEVIDSIMSGSNGRMLNDIRNKLGVTYELGSSFQPGIESGCHIFYALTSAPNIETVKDAILKEVKALREEAVPDEELEAARKHLIVSMMEELQRNETFGLKMSLDELYGLGYNDYEAYGAKINEITANQVKRVANQYFNMGNCLIVVIRGEGDEKEVF